MGCKTWRTAAPLSRHVAPMFTSFRRAGTRFGTRNLTSLATKPSEFGQPTIQSHPHLGAHFPPLVLQLSRVLTQIHSIVKRDELTPGIPVLDYEQRRRNLMDLLPEKSLVVSVAAPVKYMSGRGCHSVYFSSSAKCLQCARYLVSHFLTRNSDYGLSEHDHCTATSIANRLTSGI